MAIVNDSASNVECQKLAVDSTAERGLPPLRDALPAQIDPEVTFGLLKCGHFIFRRAARLASHTNVSVTREIVCL